ncbi:MAG TPA: rod shape-determining protein MreC [Acidiferrobacter sp.]|nr:rod shape-determining protein MreC [Acidiferrobacter sp.]
MSTFLGWSIKRPSNLTKLILFACVSIGLIVLDARHRHDTQTFRNLMEYATHPVQLLAALPFSVANDIRRDFRTNSELRQANSQLEQRDLELEAKLSRFDVLQAEVARLNKLLGGQPIPGYRETLAQILAVSSGPFTQRLVLDEGSQQHLYVGQAVLGTHGIVGQIVSVGPHTSQVMLVTDPNSGVPIVSERNGLRAIAFGTGLANRLRIPYLTVTADIRIGDIFVSSGLGGVYPAGYPVARVTEVKGNPNLAFLKVRAAPLGQLNYHTHVLLLWPKQVAHREGLHG